MSFQAFSYTSFRYFSCLDQLSRIDAAHRNFVWDAFDGSFKFPLVKQICTPLHMGGLGCPSLKIMNDALLAKWLWRFGVEKVALWRRVVAAKYVTDSMDSNSCPISSPYGVSVWRGILKRMDWFLKQIQFRLGDGSFIRFWKDIWAGFASLKVEFLTLFAFARDKDGSVLSHRSGLADRYAWNLKLRRPLNDWEIAHMTALLHRIDQVSFGMEGESDF